MKKIVIVLLITISLLFVSCTSDEVNTDNESENNQNQQQNQQQEKEAVKPEFKGDIIENNEIVNEEGGFIIPIPDSWFGNTSYENIGKETIIYHITEDLDEMSTNPILLHLGATDDANFIESFISEEVFLELNGVSFYDVPVLDFPYEIDSKDGKEYASFMEDKMLVLQSFWTTEEIGDWDYTTLLTQNNWNAKYLYDGSSRQDAEYWWVSFNPDNTFDSVYNDFSEIGVWDLDGATLRLSYEFDAQIFIIDIIEQEDGYTLMLDGYAGNGTILELESTDFEADVMSIDSPESDSMSEFTNSDATLNGLMLKCIKSEVLDNISSKFGLESQEQVEYGATGEIVDVYHYSFGSLTFSGDTFIGAVVSEPGVNGPRGFEVGDDISDIIESFAGLDALKIENTIIFYRYNGDDIETLDHVPPYLIKDEENDFLAMSCFDDESILTELSPQEIKDNYHFEVTNDCIFYFDDNNKVTSFMLNHGAMSE